MTAFLKIDTCGSCHRAIPWEWAPVVLLNGQPMAGTGVWRSQLMDTRCPACQDAFEQERAKEQQALARRKELVELLGGEKPYREFTFEHYTVTPDNRLAFERAKAFNPATGNLYLWGPCGVGKTHLASAIARRSCDEPLSVTLLPAFELSRHVRMKEPEQEQAALNGFVDTETLVLDDLGVGPYTPFTRQILQEILDGRSFKDRAGLVVTSQYSLDQLASKFGDDAIPSRLAGMCEVTRINGRDHRLKQADPSR
jgi:DNA replication protein DnaC